MEPNEPDHDPRHPLEIVVVVVRRRDGSETEITWFAESYDGGWKWRKQSEYDTIAINPPSFTSPSLGVIDFGPGSISITPGPINIPDLSTPCSQRRHDIGNSIKNGTSNFESVVHKAYGGGSVSSGNITQMRDDLTELALNGGNVGLALVNGFLNGTAANVLWGSGLDAAATFNGSSSAVDRILTNGSTYSVSPGYFITLNTSSNYRQSSSSENPNHSSIILGHELGHAVFGIRSESVVWASIENALRASMGEGARASYSDRTMAEQRAEDILQGKNPDADATSFGAQMTMMGFSLSCDPSR